MKIRMINNSKHELAAYSNEASAGMDIRAIIDKDVVLKPMERALIKTGLFLEMPFGYEAMNHSQEWFIYYEGNSCTELPERYKC